MDEQTYGPQGVAGMTGLDPRTVAADIMCGNARSITPGEVWAHIGQAYDTAEIDASIADEVTELIRKAGIDLIWPDGTSNTELDAARVDIERLTAENTLLRQLFDAAKVWRDQFAKPSHLPRQAAVIAAVDAVSAAEAVTR